MDDLAMMLPVLESGGGWAARPAPDAAFSWLPAAIQWNGKTWATGTPEFRLAGGWDVSSLAPAGKAYYVATDGDDAATGLTALVPLRALKTALAKADAVVVYIKTGEYTWGYGWDGSAIDRNISVIGYGGEVILSAHIAGLSWSLVDSHYEASYATTINGVRDRSAPDVSGNYEKLVLKTSVAEVDAAAGSWFYDGTADVIYVRTTDSRAPDADILPFVQAYNVRLTHARTQYIEGLTCYGWAPISVSGNSLAAKLYAKNCTGKYAQTSNGIAISGGAELFLQNCVSEANQLDGFKAVELGTAYANILLINCTGRNNGVATATVANGLSRHDRGATVIINSAFYGNYGPNINDLNQGLGGPRTWCLGTYCHDSASTGGTDINFGCGGVDGQMWLDTCKSDGSAIDINIAAGAGGMAYYRNLQSGGNFVGTAPTPY